MFTADRATDFVLALISQDGGLERIVDEMSESQITRLQNLLDASPPKLLAPALPKSNPEDGQSSAF